MHAPIDRRDALIQYNLILQELSNRKLRKLFKTPGHYDDEGQWTGGLYSFVRYFWDVLEPETPFVDGWPLWAICEHLEAVSDGRIKRLLINVPPGFMKSLLTDVFWPCWHWSIGRPGARFVAFSYSASLTERDNNRFADLITSNKYQAIYGNVVQPRKTGATMVSNSRHGWKFASSVGGTATGVRGDFIILDDPNSVKDAESEVVRAETNRWFREAMSNRLNSPSQGAIVIIMQRVHEDDVSGLIFSQNLDYDCLMIPMEYDPSRQLAGVPNAIGWVDPRHDEDDLDGCDGVLSWPERFTPQSLVNMKHQLGPYAWAGQYQQQPSPRGGGYFKIDWWQPHGTDTREWPVFEYVVMSVDSAFTADQLNDPTGCTVWGVFMLNGRRRIMMIHAWRKHLEFSGPRDERRTGESMQWWVSRTQSKWGLIEWIKYTADKCRVDKVLIEGKASGISAVQELRNRFGLQEWSTEACPVKGDKVSRALAVQAMLAGGGIYAPLGPDGQWFMDWADDVIQEMAKFPAGSHDDLTDATTMAWKWLRDHGMAPTDEEVQEAERERVTHKSKAGALYPI